MSTNTMEQAVSLIQQGNPHEAQKLLEVLLASDVHNLTAWFWYVKSHPAGEKRLRALELCQQNNPDNEQVKQALDKMKANVNRPAPFVQMPEPTSLRKTFLVDLFLSIIYCAIIISFVTEIQATRDFLQDNEARNGNLGFGGFMVYGFIAVVLGIQWVAIAILSPVVMAIRRKNFGLTITLVGFGVAGAIIFAGYPFAMVLSHPEISISSSMEMNVLIAIALVLFAFGLVTGLGIGTLLIFAFDVVTFIPRLLLKMGRSSEYAG